MQELRGAQALLQGLGYPESMVHTFEQNAKFYWRMWGPLGEPMVHATEQWTNLQYLYLRSLREPPGRIAPAASRGTRRRLREAGRPKGAPQKPRRAPGRK